MKRKVVAIIPVREFKNTKLRLRPYFSGAERAALTTSLLRHVLAALRNSKVDRIVIVASDESSASKVSESFVNALVIREKSHHGGVSKAMEEGIAHSRSHITDATSFMLIPSDLPFLSRAAINSAISKLSDNDLVISPSIKHDGTSLLLFNFPQGKIPLHYDDNSFKQHRNEARKLNIRYSIFPKKEFSFDLDSITDLRKLMRSLKAKSMLELSQKLESEV